jgi:hypothetical protein
MKVKLYEMYRYSWRWTDRIRWEKKKKERVQCIAIFFSATSRLTFASSLRPARRRQ